MFTLYVGATTNDRMSEPRLLDGWIVYLGLQLLRRLLNSGLSLVYIWLLRLKTVLSELSPSKKTRQVSYLRIDINM